MPSPAAIHIRRATPGDAAHFARVMSDPAVFPGTLQPPLASETQWRRRLEQNEAPERTDFVIVAEVDGEVLAHAGLNPAPQVRRRHAATLGICVLPQAQHRGVGTALMQQLCGYADGWGQLLRIELTVFADNLRAIALYERFGFRIEGRLRGFALRDGAYADALAMARLHPRPPAMEWPADSAAGTGVVP